MSSQRKQREKKSETNYEQLSRELTPLNPGLFSGMNEEEFKNSVLENDKDKIFKDTLVDMKTRLYTQTKEIEQQMENQNSLKIQRQKRHMKREPKRSRSKNPIYSRIATTVSEQTKQIEYIQKLEDDREQLQMRIAALEHALAEKERLSEIRQSTFIRRERQAESEKANLERKLNDTVSFHRSVKSSTNVADIDNSFQSVKQLHTVIAQTLDEIESEHHTVRSTEQDAANVRIRDMKSKYDQILSDERVKASQEEKDWQERSSAMKRTLHAAVNEAIALDQKNEKLIEANKKLTIQFKAQQDDRKYLTSHVAQAKRENKKLLATIKQLEQDVEYHRTITTQLSNELETIQQNPDQYFGKPPTRADAADGDLDEELLDKIRQRYESTIARLRKLLDQERRHLKAVRKAHVQLLGERTELEIFLRQCIEDVRVEIRKKRADTAIPITATDRSSIMDRLFSKEKVITLLYDRMFPFKPALPKEDYDHPMSSTIEPQPHDADIISQHSDLSDVY